MGRSKPVRLPNGRNWPTKGQAANHFKTMLARYEIGERVHSLEDHSDLSALLAVYDADGPPGTSAKVGTGIEYFEKDWDRDHPGHTQCFYVIRTDGTRIDFSIGRALDSAANQPN